MIVKLSIKGLHFSYGSAEILRDINLDIRDGQIVSIVGPNGSGKSTLIKCIDRILVPLEGDVIVDRYKVSEMKQISFSGGEERSTGHDCKALNQRASFQLR